MKNLVFGLLVMVAATSCNQPPTFTPSSISFATHPSVLRGTWSGTTTARQNLSLTLMATYDTSSQYRVAGTGSLNNEALNVTGSVVGGSLHRYLQAQTTPVPETAMLTLKRSGGADLRLTCFAIGGGTTPGSWVWQCFLPDETTSFDLTQGTS